MIHRVFVAALSLTLLAAGGVAWAQPAAPPAAAVPPEFPPPSPLNEEGVKAWVARHIETEGWILAGADGVAASFLSETGGVGQDGLTIREIRREYYGAPRLGPKGSRSVRQLWFVDCKGRKVWVRRIAVYAENNMKGASETREAPEPTWTEMSSGSLNEKLMSEACAAAPKAPI